MYFHCKHLCQSKLLCIIIIGTALLELLFKGFFPYDLNCIKGGK